jgi:hypothetical protein
MVLLELCSIQPEQSARAVPAVLGAERRQFKDFHVGRRIQKKRENIIRSQKGGIILQKVYQMDYYHFPISGQISVTQLKSFIVLPICA